MFFCIIDFIDYQNLYIFAPNLALSAKAGSRGTT